MTYKIKDKFGIHARVATEIVNLVTRYDAQVAFTVGGISVAGDSIIALMQLGTKQGDLISVKYLRPLKDHDEFERLLGKIIEG